MTDRKFNEALGLHLRSVIRCGATRDIDNPISCSLKALDTVFPGLSKFPYTEIKNSLHLSTYIPILLYVLVYERVFACV